MKNLKTKRFITAGQLRDSGLSNNEIAKRMAINVDRVKILLKRYSSELEYDSLHSKDKYWGDGLSVMALRILNNVGVYSRKEAKDAIMSGLLVPGHRPKGYGIVTDQEIRMWLGISLLG